eukprot:jgi/Galph1/2705/GphlegSOOS_G1358.1
MESAGKRRRSCTFKRNCLTAQQHSTDKKLKKRKRTVAKNTESKGSERCRIFWTKHTFSGKGSFTVASVQILEPRGKTKYGRNSVSVGDIVFVASDESDPYIARVDKIIVKPRASFAHKKLSDWYHGKNCSIFLNLRWFFYPKELMIPLDFSLKKKEVLLSNHNDENSVDCFLKHCHITFELEKVTSNGDNSFICRFFYDCKRQVVRKLTAEDMEHLFSHTRRPMELVYRIGKNESTSYTLIGREQEVERIKDFLAQTIRSIADGKNKGERSMYINGVPGAGKTASVRHVVDELKKNPDYRDKFIYVEINAMLLSDPQEAYSVLFSSIFGLSAGCLKASQELDKYFGNEKIGNTPKNRKTLTRPCIVVVLDELDVLLSRKQKVVYDFLEWPTREGSSLVVVAIANTMDLPERVLLPRIGSRLGINRISFAPYTSSQLRDILQYQIPLQLHCSSDKFEQLALELCSKKIAAVTGDVRRAFHICRLALELAEKDGSKTVGMTHIQESFQELFQIGPIASIGQLSIAETLVYCAALLCERYYGSDSIYLNRIIRHAIDLNRVLSMPLDLDSGSILEICCHLAHMRHISFQWHPVESLCKIYCNIHLDDACFALKDTPFFDILTKT